MYGLWGRDNHEGGQPVGIGPAQALPRRDGRGMTGHNPAAPESNYTNVVIQNCGQLCGYSETSLCQETSRL